MSLLALGLGFAFGPVSAWAADREGPRVVVDREEHHFGGLDVNVAGRHEFVFSNAGKGPLVLSRGRSTCGCCTCVCSVRLPQEAIAPGESGKVALEWISKLYVGPFRQTATILTNDPRRGEVTLHVAGRFKGPVGVVPSQLRFSRVPPDQPATAKLRLHSYLIKPLEIVGYELADPHTAEHFEVAWEPLTLGQLEEEPEARGGYMLRVTVRPGLPQGAFRQRIVINTSSESAPTVEIPVEGVVAGDVSIVGRGWNSRTGTLAMGTVRSRQGAVWSLIILVRGRRAKDVKFELVRIVPDLLEVELGATTYIAASALSQTRLTIRIPPGSPPATHLGSDQGEPGHLTLRTNHPEAPELRLLVRFAVAD